MRCLCTAEHKIIGGRQRKRMKFRKIAEWEEHDTVPGGDIGFLLEAVDVTGAYRVVVTFLEPVREAETKSARQFERFWASFGAWQDERPVEATLQDIRAARRSRPEPPSL